MFEIPQSELDKLNGAAFSEDSEDHEESEEETKAEEVVKESTEAVSASTDEDAVADKARIPYSRFQTVNEEKIRAEERARLLEEQLAEFKRPVTADTQQEIELPPEWVELYGDGDVARKAYQIQLNVNERIQEEAANKAYERMQSRAKEEQESVSKGLEIIEDGLKKFQETLGRSLTETEENAILDVQDEFTPKDENGNYIAPLFSPEKAYEVYTLRTQAAKAAKTQAKRGVVSLTGASSEGDVSSSNANYNPQSWGSWRDKV